jgi:hypothetical protein
LLIDASEAARVGADEPIAAQRVVEEENMATSSMIAGGILVTVLALPAAAQVLYKSVLPDGRVVYGDKPDPNAVKVEKQRPDISKRGIGGSTDRETEALRDMERQRVQRERQSAAGESRLRGAQEALKNAEAALAAGKEPLPGERIGIAGGGSRLTEGYFDRQKKLEADVEHARREVERLRSAR